MRITTDHAGREQALAELFARSFAVAEEPEAGALIRGLVQDLLSQVPAPELRVFMAEDAGTIIGAAIFTPLTFAEDPRRVVLLSPVAVAPERQRQGVGRAMLHHALADLRTDAVDAAITYGDPAYYGRVGFRPIAEAQARAPLPLSQPQGWLGQSLTGPDMPVLRGASRCVAPLDRADIW